MGGSAPGEGPTGFYSKEQLRVIALLVSAVACLLAWRVCFDPANLALRALPRLPAVYELGGSVERPGFFSFREEQTAAALLEAGGSLQNGARFFGDLPVRVKAGTRVLFGPSVVFEDMGPRARLNFFLPIPINQAAAEDLACIPGIGMKTARAIVALRARCGAVRDLGELRAVKGIGPKKLASLAPYMTVGK